MASSKASIRPERTVVGGKVEISRMINGMWQLAGGHDAEVNIATASKAIDVAIQYGLDTFDMADHYGDAELIMGHHSATSPLKTTSCTKWCPQENGVKTLENAEAAVDLALQRLGQSRIDLLQYHAWDFSDDTYLHNLTHLHTLQSRGKITLIGLTNTDAAHLELLLNSGIPIATNQVPANVLDRRLVRGRLASVCDEHGVGVLAYATLLGGFLSEKWLGAPEPASFDELNWSLRKYLRFIHVTGGWEPFQEVLRALQVVAKRHGVGIPAVATRWVLDIPCVKAVVVGSRLNEDSERYMRRNLEAFTFGLTAEDVKLIEKAQAGLTDVPGDCGDEYRRPPYLTAKGDLGDHLQETDRTRLVREAIEQGKRVEYSTGSLWEPIAGYCRAVRTGSTIRISGTTSSVPRGLTLPNNVKAVGGASARSQTVHILDVHEGALKALGSSLADVVRTRVMVRDVAVAEHVSRAHGWVFLNASPGGVLPANTLVTAGLVGDQFLVEIEAEAEAGAGAGAGAGKNGVVRIGKA